MDFINHFINQIKYIFMKTFFLLLGIASLNTCNTNKQNSSETSETKSVEYRDVTTDSKTKGSLIIEDKQPITESKVATVNSSLNNITVKDTILNNIQSKITSASYDAFAKRNTSKLDELEKLLSQNNERNNSLFNYWIAYINYYKTIVSMQTKDKVKGLETNKKSIQLLEQNKNKNSDDYALLVLSKGLSFTFVSGMDAALISKDISNYLEDGFKLDNSNLRLYYAQGSLDFYTPKEYGGGKKVEEALLKAISLQDKNIGKSNLPTWGKEESYELLIRFYLANIQKEEASKQYKEIKKYYPNSYIINMYKSKLE